MGSGFALLSHPPGVGFWQQTGDTGPFDTQWKEAAWTIVQTFRTQQRKQGKGPYSFQRQSGTPTDTLALDGFGNPAIPVGMIFSMFRPSDDACTYPLFVPANLFAVVSLRQLLSLANQVLKDVKLAQEAHLLAAEVGAAVNQYGKTQHAKYGEIWAYEVDGYGNTLMMDDANAPGLKHHPQIVLPRKRCLIPETDNDEADPRIDESSSERK